MDSSSSVFISHKTAMSEIKLSLVFGLALYPKLTLSGGYIGDLIMTGDIPPKLVNLN